MLVLSRQRDETIMIGDEVEITVVDVRGDKVRIGINAPTRVAVHRKEVYKAIQDENREAARLAGQDEDPTSTPSATRAPHVKPTSINPKLTITHAPTRQAS
jgi:carbon storage regulator